MRICLEENVGQDVTSIEFGHTFRRIVRIDAHDGTVYLSEKLYMRVDTSSLPVHFDAVHAVDVENGQLCMLNKDAQVVRVESRILSDAFYKLVSSGGEIIHNLLKSREQSDGDESCQSDNVDSATINRCSNEADEKLKESSSTQDISAFDRAETVKQLFTDSYDDQDVGCIYLGREA